MFTVLLAACGAGSKSDSTPKVTATPAASNLASPSAASEKPAPADTPNPRVSDEPVAFQTDDGATIHGHLYTTPGPRQRAVIFAHMYPNDQRAWQPFAREMAATGVAALTFDFRGYGESAGNKEPSKADHDLTYALLFMKSRDYPLVYLVGASMGGTAVLKVAAAQETAGIITISAPLSFMGLDATGDLPEDQGPKVLHGQPQRGRRRRPGGAADLSGCLRPRRASSSSRAPLTGRTSSWGRTRLLLRRRSWLSSRGSSPHVRASAPPPPLFNLSSNCEVGRLRMEPSEKAASPCC